MPLPNEASQPVTTTGVPSATMPSIERNGDPCTCRREIADQVDV